VFNKASQRKNEKFPEDKKTKTIKSHATTYLQMSKKEEEETTKDELSVLKTKISYLEEELVRNHKIIEKLKEENLVLFKTALKNSKDKLA
jgi:hypothetical protein